MPLANAVSAQVLVARSVHARNRTGTLRKPNDLYVCLHLYVVLRRNNAAARVGHREPPARSSHSLYSVSRKWNVDVFPNGVDGP